MTPHHTPELGALYRVLAESAPDPILTIDESSTILSVNPAAERVFGYAAAEMIGQPLGLLMPERMQAGHHAGMGRYLATGRRHISWTGVRVPIRTKSGAEIPAEISFGEFVAAGRRLFSGFIRDVSDRVAAELALAATNARLQGQSRELAQANQQLQDAAAELEVQAEELQEAAVQLEERIGDAERERRRVAAVLASISDAFFALDREWRFTYVNDRAEEMIGRPRETLLGRSMWTELASAVGTAFEREYRRAVDTGQPVIFEEFYAPLDAWFEVHAYPGPEGLAVYFQDVTERRHAAADALARGRRAAFAGDVGLAVTATGPLPAAMQRCCQAAVDHLGAAFARVWVADAREPLLTLVASAGCYTHVDGPHGRVPLGQFKIGQIAADRRPHLTNAVVGDARVHDQGWAAREGMVAFAGYPLVVGDDVVGVFALFARHALGAADFAALGSAATAISVTVANARLLAAERAARAEAEAARAEAEAASRAKSDFLATMSHELRTPLNAIGGYAELLEMGIRGPVTDQQREDLARIQRSQRHLLALINEVLNYARLESGAVAYDLADVPVPDAVAAAEVLVAPQLRAKGLAYSWSGCDAEVVVRADRDKLQQILLNLLSNAVKFTNARAGLAGRVEVSCAVDGADPSWHVRIRVTDTGVGIPADKLQAVFEPFVQVDQRLTRLHGGTGLGLAISRDLARGMGGDLTAESALGVGSTFTLTLPRA